jgi:hypothetical protein
VILALGLVSGTILIFNLLGFEAIRHIGTSGRYRTRFADIQCDPPRGLDRSTFLTEVRYLSGFPEVFHALDETERQQLVAAFAKHPWVESVDGVEVEPGNVVRLKLTYRIPVLAVRTDRGAVRLVTHRGVLLPESESPQGVAELVSIVPLPTVNAGETWPDEMVQRSLDLMKSYSIAKLERTHTDWRLTLRDGTSLQVGK